MNTPATIEDLDQDTTWAAPSGTIYTLDVRGCTHDGYGVAISTPGKATLTCTFTCGSMHPWPTIAHVLSWLSTWPQYVYKDGDPSHGMEPFSDAQSTHVGDNPFCETLGYDPHDPASLTAFNEWRARADTAIALLGDDLSGAYELA